MSRAVSFIVPGPPVPKARPRVSKRGTYTPNKTAEYERLVQLQATAARLRASTWRMDAQYSVEIFVYRSRAGGDLDNIVKSALDGMNGALWDDDAQVVEIHAFRRPPDANGQRLEVRVSLPNET